MKVKIHVGGLSVLKNSLTEVERGYCNSELSNFPESVSIADTPNTYAVSGSKEALYDFLWTLSRSFDIELI